ncbi:DUF427 domain-containing protein [Synechococcus sp. A10-1-5-1]|uniref:DUF427 domain-containing protein n=1 Tax=Synechococcus sp. A10-1-5-1 TaxID=2936507 RepID=UPI002001345A|nr:DUF427 domain-containing protein [Synechococcus sp. A10-1-5-1]UPM51010.1 DUF427 domain-containing protein [Synechococcus sp. A10-1-5-1]
MHSTPERVCDYPRPPALQASSEHIVVRAFGTLLAETQASYRVLETFHPPTYYLPPEAFAKGALVPAGGRSFCEWKGIAHYFDIVLGDRCLPKAAWSYAQPSPSFAPVANWIALYPALMEGCWVDGELVTPQPGGFYGGWITSRVEGPFKGDPSHPELI